MEVAANTHDSIVSPSSRLSTTSEHHSYQTLDSSDRLHMLQFTVAPGGTQIGCLSGKYLTFRRWRFTSNVSARQDTSACKEVMCFHPKISIFAHGKVLTSGNQENMPTENELGAMLTTDDLLSPSPLFFVDFEWGDSYSTEWKDPKNP